MKKIFTAALERLEHGTRNDLQKGQFGSEICVLMMARELRSDRLSYRRSEPKQTNKQEKVQKARTQRVIHKLLYRPWLGGNCGRSPLRKKKVEVSLPLSQVERDLFKLIDNYLIKAALPELIYLFLHRCSPSWRAGSGLCPSEMAGEACHFARYICRNRLEGSRGVCLRKRCKVDSCIRNHFCSVYSG